MLISIKYVQTISLTGGVAPLPAPPRQKDRLRAGSVRILFFADEQSDGPCHSMGRSSCGASATGVSLIWSAAKEK
jgi:hypothetical protein